MNWKERLRTYINKWKPRMQVENMSFQSFLAKWQELWKAGKIQRVSRISYSVIWNIILFFLIVGLIACFFVVGIGAGYFASLVKDEPVRSFAAMKQDIYNYEETSKLYFAGGTISEIYNQIFTAKKQRWIKSHQL